MTERHPIYSGQATGQPIGYIEDNQAFDLFDRLCATYEGNTGLLRDPKNTVAPIIRELQRAGHLIRGMAIELDKRKLRTPRGGAWHPQLVERIVERLG